MAMMMKHVDGQPVEMTPEEETALLVERAAAAATPDPVPDATPLQLFDELDETYGIDLEAQIAALDPKALSRVRLANTIRRQDPFIVFGMQPAMGWTDAQVDTLFRAAAARNA